VLEIRIEGFVLCHFCWWQNLYFWNSRGNDFSFQVSQTYLTYLVHCMQNWT